MKASRKDFKAIAQALKENREYLTDGKLRYAHETLCIAIANVLALSNPAFRRDLFMEACGVEAKEGTPDENS